MVRFVARRIDRVSVCKNILRGTSLVLIPGALIWYRQMKADRFFEDTFDPSDSSVN